MSEELGLGPPESEQARTWTPDEGLSVTLAQRLGLSLSDSQPEHLLCQEA
jgi:hypothetical protein